MSETHPSCEGSRSPTPSSSRDDSQHPPPPPPPLRPFGIFPGTQFGGNPPTSPTISIQPDQIATVITSVRQGLGMHQPAPRSMTAHVRERSTACSHRAVTLEAASVRLPKLKEENYSHWEFAVSLAIRNVGLWDHIEGTARIPAPTETRKYDKYLQESGAIINAIAGSLDHEAAYRYLEGTFTPKEAWEAIRKHYRSNDRERLMAIDMELTSLKLADSGNAIDHVNTFCRLRRQLERTNFALHDERKTHRQITR